MKPLLWTFAINKIYGTYARAKLSLRIGNLPRASFYGQLAFYVGN